MPLSRHHLAGLLAALALASAAHAADDSVWVRFPNGVEKRGVLVSQSALSLRIAETQWERMREVYLTIRYERVAALRLNGIAVDTPVTLAAIERARQGLPAAILTDSGTPPAVPATGAGAPQAPAGPAPEPPHPPRFPPPTSAPAPEVPAGSPRDSLPAEEPVPVD